MIKLHDIDHVEFGVQDLDASSNSWQVEFGLLERNREGRTSYLAVNYEPFSVVLETSNEVGIQYAAYNLHPDFSLDDAEAHLKLVGVEYTRSDTCGEYPSGPSRSKRGTPHRRFRVSSLRNTTAPGTAPTNGARPRASVDFPEPEKPPIATRQGGAGCSSCSASARYSRAMPSSSLRRCRFSTTR